MDEKLLDLENDGLNMAYDEGSLYIRCKRDLYRCDADLRVTARCTVFPKDGKARSFGVYQDDVWMVDFCDLYLLRKRDLRLINRLHLGEDASSDLGAVRFDEKYAYIGVRNGKMIRMDRETRSHEMFSLCDSSSWDHAAQDGKLYVGTVRGDLLEVDAGSMQVTRSLPLCKKNIYSLCIQDQTLYASCQDGAIRAVDLALFAPLRAAKKAVKGMTKILGIAGNRLVIADGGISVWDKNSLTLLDRFPFPTGHFNKGAILLGDIVIGSDYTGVYRRAL